ncbi:trehalose-6-phosphate synthase [Natrarchaeobaculum aegyptiacum]|uniref:Trehalose-6-phosphate synthase n=1 Tax=Natrarchaeobaculum aegyptiacum TaxID=745377 RepID=A0A2Z2HP08_9EURY|nr:trehalose-6-phosphate synthase [Natrarchaeobaculum aegyptiacum]
MDSSERSRDRTSGRRRSTTDARDRDGEDGGSSADEAEVSEDDEDGNQSPNDSYPDSLIVVSNRQPYRHEYEDVEGGSGPGNGDGDDGSDGTSADGGEVRTDGDDREITVDEPAGGLTAGLDPVLQEASGTWIAWGDGEADFAVTDDDNRVSVPPDDESYTLRRIDIPDEAVEGYYYGFSNRVLWPLCHEFPGLVDTRPDDLEWYRRVNERFADAIVDSASAQSTVWIQDYHFALAPRLVQESTPESTTVAQFWHIPWPDPETFEVCPAHTDLLEGVLGNDLLGFHVERYGRQFLACVDEYLPEASVDRARLLVEYEGSTTRVVATPMGVDAETYDRSARSTDPTAVHSLFDDCTIDDDTVLGLGVDRLDYSKGIPERLAGIERFFERNPAWRGAFTFVQKATPSRTDIPAYDRYGELVREDVARINARFATGDWQPIVYTEEYFSQEELSALYRRADVMVVSSLLDGMNLVAQEYVAATVDGDGTLLLSDRAGAHDRLGTQALTIDPTDADGVAEQLERAVSMPRAERKRRMHRLRTKVFDADLERWMNAQFDWIARVHGDGGLEGGRGRYGDSNPDSDASTSAESADRSTGGPDRDTHERPPSV